MAIKKHIEPISGRRNVAIDARAETWFPCPDEKISPCNPINPEKKQYTTKTKPLTKNITTSPKSLKISSLLKFNLVGFAIPKMSRKRHDITTIANATDR